MGRVGSGVEVRETSIRISFVWEGKPRKETLRTNGDPVAPTPANVKYAHRIAAEIKDRIKHGSFVYADYFPASKTATTGHGTTVGDQLGLWLELQANKEASTIKGYRVAVNWWQLKIGPTPLKALKHSAILSALASEPTWSGKTRNNKASVLRQSLALAIRDGLIQSNPMDGIEASPHQKPEPDPFSMQEVELILGDMAKRYHPQIANHFETKFFTGFRTSEALGLRWESIDWRAGTATVTEAIVLGEHKESTKTHKARTVQLNSRALAALTRQKEHTLMLNNGGWVFQDPKAGKRWVDDWTPREMYWRPTLKRLGLRYRSPYQTRHTYATIMLMSGVSPAYGARQMGHSVEMFLRLYARWIDGGQNEVEMNKVEGLIGADCSLILPRRKSH
jgi:integrase